MKALLFLFFFITSMTFAEERPWPRVINGIDTDALAKDLATKGVSGWVHAANPHFKQFVFTYRDSGNFFKFINFSLIGKSDEALRMLKTLRRHDKVLIKGGFSKKNHSPFPHIHATGIDMITRYTGAPDLPPYTHNTDIPAELGREGTLEGKVHIVFNEGKAMVIEYKDVVLPLLVEGDLVQQAAALWRNDIIRLDYKVRRKPRGPFHLEMTGGLVVIDRMGEGHNTPIELEGSLSLFPKSPQIIFNIFALKVKHPEQNTQRNYTIVNFEDMDLFMKIREKLQKLWDKNQASALPVRNHFNNPTIRLRVRGTKNVVNGEQANPQVLVNSLDDIELF
jgi:hypothetical protein